MILATSKVVNRKKPIRGPVGGYGFEAKEKYRETIWETFSKNSDPGTAVALLLPSKEGLEIPVALSYGFREENLIAVDNNPAIIATAKWRKQYPNIKFYGNDIGRAAERIAKDGIKIDLANLDLCSNLSTQTLSQLYLFFSSGCLSGKSLVALTMLSGREQHAVNLLAEMYLKEKKYDKSFGNMEKRLEVVFSFIKDSFSHVFSINQVLGNEYKSSTQKMVYGVVSVVSHSHSRAELLEKQKPIFESIVLHNKLCEEQKLYRDYVANGPGYEFFEHWHKKEYEKESFSERPIYKKLRKDREYWGAKTEDQRFVDLVYCSVITRLREKIKNYASNMVAGHPRYSMCWFRNTMFNMDELSHLWRDFEISSSYDFWTGYKRPWGGNYYKPNTEDKKDKKLIKYLDEIVWRIER